jgi:hypothetical protein
MAPRINTPEYTLLTKVRDTLHILPTELNSIALAAALAEGFVRYDGEYIVLTDAGFDRIDQIEDRG